MCGVCVIGMDTNGAERYKPRFPPPHIYIRTWMNIMRAQAKKGMYTRGPNETSHPRVALSGRRVCVFVGG